MTADRWLGVVGLALTIVLGVAAIIIAVRSDRRASRASTAASDTLTAVDGVVRGLPEANARITAAVDEVDDQVGRLRETILGFYRDILGLVSASFESFLHGARGDRPLEAGKGNDGFAGTGGGWMPRSAQAEGLALDEAIIRTVAEAAHKGEVLSAQQLIERLGADVHLYRALTELYRMRISRRIAWTDAILGPLTTVTLDEDMDSSGSSHV